MKPITWKTAPDMFILLVYLFPWIYEISAEAYMFFTCVWPDKAMMQLPMENIILSPCSSLTWGCISRLPLRLIFVECFFFCSSASLFEYGGWERIVSGRLSTKTEATIFSCNLLILFDEPTSRSFSVLRLGRNAHVEMHKEKWSKRWKRIRPFRDNQENSTEQTHEP